MNLNTEFNKTQYDFNNQTGNFTPLANIYKNGKTLDQSKLISKKVTDQNITKGEKDIVKFDAATTVMTPKQVVLPQLNTRKPSKLDKNKT